MLVAKGIGILFFRFPRPEGLPDVDTPRAAMIRNLADNKFDDKFETKEREYLFSSLAMTLCRALYHQKRFIDIIDLLNKRHEEVGCNPTYDLFAQYALFEASGVLGAIRLGIDEIVFIAARLEGVSANKADKYWKANKVMEVNLKEKPQFNIPVVRILQEQNNWYRELNDYRNVLHHRGWHPQLGAYYPTKSNLPEACSPIHNVMLVPDRTSLKGRNRPHKWTYTDAYRLEYVVETAITGFEKLIDGVCINIWGGSVPCPGSMPKSEQPNLFVGLPRPALLYSENDIILPVFTDPKSACNFDRRLSYTNELELVEIGPIKQVVREPAFSFSLEGLHQVVEAQSLKGDLILYINPSSVSDSQAEAQRIPLEQLLKVVETEPVNIVQSAINSKRIWLWRKKPKHDISFNS